MGKSRKSRTFGYAERENMYTNHGNVTRRWVHSYPLGEESIYSLSDVFCYHSKWKLEWNPDRIAYAVRGTHPLWSTHGASSAPPAFDWRQHISAIPPMEGIDLSPPSFKELEKSIVNPNNANFLLTLVEAPDIPKLFDDSFKGLVNAIKPKGQRVRASDAYLGTVFGALPLINDLKVLNKNLKGMSDHTRRLLAPGEQETIRTSRKYEDSGSLETYIEYPDFNRRALLSWERKMLVGFTYKTTWTPPKRAFMPFMDYYGLRPDASDLWELIPLSFVVDWFVDIGGALGDLDMTSISKTFNTVAGWRSRKCTYKYTFEFLDDHPEWQQDGEKGYQPLVVHHKYYERVISSPSIPSLAPGFRFGLSKSKAVTLGALGRSFSRGHLSLPRSRLSSGLARPRLRTR